MMSHRYYLPAVGFSMTQRRLDLFIWMPSSFHLPVPYADFILLSTDNLTRKILHAKQHA